MDIGADPIVDDSESESDSELDLRSGSDSSSDTDTDNDNVNVNHNLDTDNAKKSVGAEELRPLFKDMVTVFHEKKSVGAEELRPLFKDMVTVFHEKKLDGKSTLSSFMGEEYLNRIHTEIIVPTLNMNNRHRSDLEDLAISGNIKVKKILLLERRKSEICGACKLPRNLSSEVTTDCTSFLVGRFCANRIASVELFYSGLNNLLKCVQSDENSRLKNSPADLEPYFMHLMNCILRMQSAMTKNNRKYGTESFQTLIGE